MHIYADAVASMWNSYRQGLLHLTDLHCRTRKALNADIERFNLRKESNKLQDEMQCYIEEVCASIPYMLLGEAVRGSMPTGGRWFHDRPPMLLGGFSLQWVLFTISTLQTVSPSTKRQMKVLLQWLATNLGIGQASVLVSVSVRSHQDERRLMNCCRQTRSRQAVSLGKAMLSDGHASLCD